MTNILSQWAGDMTFDTHINGLDISIDAGKAGEYPIGTASPKCLMLVSLAGCTGVDVIFQARKINALPSGLRIDIHGRQTTKSPKYYEYVKVDYHFYGTELDEDKLHACVKSSEENNCGVMLMFKKFAKVELELFFHAEEPS